MKKNSSIFRRIALIVGVSLGCLVLDQGSKVVAEAQLKGLPPQEFLDGFFRLQYIENPGAFLGLGGSFSEKTRFWIFTACVAIVMVLMARSLWREVKSGDRYSALWTVGLTLLFSGGLGNLIDRVFRGQGMVIDFMNVGIGPVRTGIFNVADMAILAGIAILTLKPKRP